MRGIRGRLAWLAGMGTMQPNTSIGTGSELGNMMPTKAVGRMGAEGLRYSEWAITRSARDAASSSSWKREASLTMSVLPGRRHRTWEGVPGW